MKNLKVEKLKQKIKKTREELKISNKFIRKSKLEESKNFQKINKVDTKPITLSQKIENIL